MHFIGRRLFWDLLTLLLNVQLVQWEMMHFTGRRLFWDLLTLHLKAGFSSSTSISPQITPSSPLNSPSPPASTIPTSTATAPSAWTSCAPSGPPRSPYQKCCSQSVPSFVIPTLTILLCQRSPGSTRPT